MCERCNRPLREHPEAVTFVDTPPPPAPTLTPLDRHVAEIVVTAYAFRSDGRVNHSFVCDRADCVNCRHHDCDSCGLSLQDHGA